MSKRFETLKGERQLFLDRARNAAELTLPLVVREEGHDSGTTYKTPYQSTGARGVTNLSSNLLLSLFPTNSPFFRLLVSESDFEAFGEDADKVMQEVNDDLSDIERTVLEEIEGKNLRATLFEVLKNLLIAGNSLVYVLPDATIKNYTIEDYVCHRDTDGNVTDIIIKERVSIRTLRSLELALPEGADKEDSVNREVSLFTVVKLDDDGKTYSQWQEIKGDEIAGTRTEHKRDELPWLALRLTKITGESYGRGYVEQVIGDLKSLEALQKAIIEAAAITAKVVFMVRPGTQTRAKDLTQANNGDVINGDANDVTTLQVNKSGDLSVALQASNVIEQRLSFSFNLLDATLPTGGATTATEINAIVNSLEKVLAGTYAMLTSEFIQPLVTLIIGRLQEMNRIPDLPKQVKLIISTGLTSLGRNSDIERLLQFSQMAAQVSPEAYAEIVDQEALLRQLESAVGVDVLKSKETLAEEQAQLQAAAEQEQRQILAQQLLTQEQGEEPSPEELVQ